jgi:hypothetical protein
VLSGAASFFFGSSAGGASFLVSVLINESPA